MSPFLALLAACVFITDAEWDARHDQDADGVHVDVDCDDQDADRGGPVTWHPDADADGFGEGPEGITACAAPAGHVDNDQDCDDADPSTYPGAPESCDAIDHDCDGVAVEDDAVDAPRWHPDADADGFGDPSQTRFACAAPEGHADNDDDCDDADPLRFPGAEERCGNGLVDDCRLTPAEAWGLCAVEGELPADQADAYLAGASSFVGAGWAVAGPGDMDGDGLDDVAISSPYLSETAPRAGGVHVIRGPAEGLTALDEADFVLLGAEAEGRAGWALAAPGDVDGDGIADLLVGAPGATDGGLAVGAASLVLGPLTGDVDLTRVELTLWGVAEGGEAGAALAGLDADGDGLPELAMGAPTAGRVTVFVDLRAARRLTMDEGWGLSDDTPEAGFGSAIAGLDFDGDGRDDLAVGAPATGSSGGEPGRVLVFTQLDGAAPLSAADAAFQVWSDEGADQLGAALAGVSDLDGDGRAELLAGAPGADGAGSDAGAVLLFLGGAEGVVSQADHDLIVRGEAGGDGLGYALATVEAPAGVAPSLLLGAATSSAGGFAAGRAYLVHDPPAAGLIRPTDADLVLDGAAGLSALGFSAADAGDVDGDGVHDLLLGAPGEALGTGRAVIVRGTGF